MFFAATTPPRFATLVLISALSVLSLNMFLPSLPNIAAAFQADYALVNLAIAGYAGVTAVLMVIIGPLSDRYGRRPVLLAGLGIFIVASLGGALAATIWVFLAFRMVQGVVICGWVLSNAVIRDTAPERDAASLMGYLAMAWSVAPMLGPAFGGLLDEVFGWRANFVAFIVFGTAIFGLSWVDLGETNSTPTATFAHQVRAYPALLGSRRFWGYALCMAFSAGAFYVFLGGAPLVAATVLSLSPAVLGIYVGTITVGFALGSFLSGRYARRLPPTAMIIAGRIVACTGLSVGLMLVLAGIVNVFSIFGATVFVGIGNGLTMPSSNAGAMSVRRELAGSAAGLAGALTVAGGAALSATTGAMLSKDNGAIVLLGAMLASSAAALIAALYVHRVDRRAG